MNSAFLFDGGDQRLDRVPAPAVTPISGTDFDSRSTAQISVLVSSPGYTITYKVYTGTPPAPPANINDGTTATNSVTLTAPWSLNFVAVAFDPAGVLTPSVPVGGSYVRYDMGV
jgi:hypothetical protein